jgi:arylsulfatase A-like enzyme
MDMKSTRAFSRRDFLKLVSLLPVTYSMQPLMHLTRAPGDAQTPNVIVIVFDAWSANHLSFYGYPRRTMPNLERFMEKATVYHNHYAAGTFTVPATASLLTGLYPWTHRALSLSGGIIKSQLEHQVFAALSKTHSTLAYTQNKYADILLFQASKYLDTHFKADAFHLGYRSFYNLPIFKKDSQVAFASLDDNVFLDGSNQDSSLFINPIYRLLQMDHEQTNTLRYAGAYPIGLPNDTAQFLLSDVVDGALEILQGLREPSFAYLHFYPPHEGYAPEQNFYKTFSGGWQPSEKPLHRLSWMKESYSTLNQLNQAYDEYIASWDEEVNRLFEYLSISGLVDRSYVVITADHGELNERGEEGHFTPLIFDPLIHIPLIISQPGQQQRMDIHSATSSVDVLPTLAHLTGNGIPEWAEGELLPAFGGVADPQRSIYSMDAKTNSAFEPFTNISISLTRAGQRLTYYCYGSDRQFEFYDLEHDPDELKDLYPSQPDVARSMQDELLNKLDEVNRAGEV